MWELKISLATRPPRWYMKNELLETAQKAGFRVTESQFDDWVEKGLLGQGKKEWPGRGHGSGSQVMWPEGQLSLFMELLQARQRKPAYHIGDLCVFPVWRWIYQSEQGGVNLLQVQRAMNTWITARKKVSLDRSRQEAHSLGERLQEKHSIGKRDLLRELTTLRAFQKEVNKEDLRYLLEPIVHPLIIGTETYPDGRAAVLAYMMELLHKAYHTYEQIQQFPDPLWEWARVVRLLGSRIPSWSWFQSEFPRLAWKNRLTVYDTLKDCTENFLTSLSLALVDFVEEKDDTFFAFLNPRSWEEGRVTSRIETTYVPSSLWLPNGSNLLYLRNTVYLIGQEKTYWFRRDLPFQ